MLQPYAGVSLTESSFLKIERKYLVCTRYKIMVDCWHTCPDSRPSFRSLETRLENILENREEYLEMNLDKAVIDRDNIVNNVAYGEYVNNLGDTNPLLNPR